MRSVGIVTSGGDAPGMNAAIRAVVRKAIPNGFRMIGIERGYAGLLADETRHLGLRSVSGIVHLGGTILRTERCSEFKTKKGLERAWKVLEKDKIKTLVVVGGKGSFKGALELSDMSGINIIGIPASIDNDVYGTDETLGFDTAVNTALSAIDKIRDTATSLSRVFVVETMGRDRGFIALAVGLAAGAEGILVPEVKTEMNSIYKKVIDSREKGKTSDIIVIAEGFGNSRRIAESIEKNTGYETRLTVLGYIQRGGAPTARSRILANLFGSKAVELILDGEENRIVCLSDGRVTSADLSSSCRLEKPLDLKMLRLAEELAV